MVKFARSKNTAICFSSDFTNSIYIHTYKKIVKNILNSLFSGGVRLWEFGEDESSSYYILRLNEKKKRWHMYHGTGRIPKGEQRKRSPFLSQPPSHTQESNPFFQFLIYPFKDTLYTTHKCRCKTLFSVKYKR